MRTIITTVGTSLLTNRDDRPWRWRFGDPFPAAQDIAQWLPTAHPTAISAETHTWYRLGTFESGPTAQIVLIHSATPDGQFCAEQLRQYAESKSLKAECRQVNDLSYADADTFNRGLGQLVRVIAEAIHQYRRTPQSDVVIAATGGFKAEIAIANLVGTLLGVPVCYIYQQFEQLVTIEPLPISLAPEFLKFGAGKAFLQTLVHQDCCRQNIDSFLKQDRRLELLIDSADEQGDEQPDAPVCLNLLGELAAQLLDAPAPDWPPTCDTLPDDKIKLENAAHHRPTGWQEVVNRLARSQFVRQIRYDGTAGNQKGLFPATDSAVDFWVVLNDGTYLLPLRVETTAETSSQRRLVMTHLKPKVRL